MDIETPVRPMYPLQPSQGCWCVYTKLGPWSLRLYTWRVKDNWNLYVLDYWSRPSWSPGILNYTLVPWHISLDLDLDWDKGGCSGWPIQEVHSQCPRVIGMVEGWSTIIYSDHDASYPGIPFKRGKLLNTATQMSYYNLNNKCTNWFMAESIQSRSTETEVNVLCTDHIYQSSSHGCCTRQQAVGTKVKTPPPNTHTPPVICARPDNHQVLPLYPV